MNTHALVTIKTIYGQDRVYPANDVAYSLAALLGSKTFTKEQLAKARELGFTFEIKAQEHVL
jgi:D-alanyl-D-alanine carboxypeptidase|tara:strand:- start:445 stop:630 length:186 start_codon:yes stop_codon:yes gene_type:complete